MNRLKFAVAIILVSSLYLVRLPEVVAQVRGPGVGALAGNNNGTTTISITNGKTAPWAEVIVDSSGGVLQAVAEIDATGLFSFSFNTLPGNVGSLVIYAVDEAGVTERIAVSSTSLSDFILPPTIIGNTTNLPDTSVGLRGFSYPGATITLSLASVEGYSETFVVDADGVTGAWTKTVDDLSAGTYTAHARASFSSETSIESQDLTFIIPAVTSTPGGGIIPGGEEIQEFITDTASAAANLMAAAGDALNEILSNFPEVTTKNAGTFSKALAPVVATTILWGSGLLNVFLSFDYLTSGIRILLGFFVPLKRKRNRWGVVYDAVTKMPIGRAIVRLYKVDGGLIETEATGKNGIFSFLTDEGNYEIKVVHPECRFPSQLVFTADDGEYQTVYRGGSIFVSKAAPVINVSIPMDPKGYDIVPAYNRTRDFLRKFVLYANAFLYGLGLSLSVISFVISPIFINFIIILFYCVSMLLLVRKIYDDRTKWGTVVDALGSPASGVSLSLLDSVFKRLVQRRVADRYGRFQFVVPKGGYVMRVSSPEWELSPQSNSYDGGLLNVQKDIGVLKTRVNVAKKGEWAFGAGK